MLFHVRQCKPFEYLIRPPSSCRSISISEFLLRVPQSGVAHFPTCPDRLRAGASARPRPCLSIPVSDSLKHTTPARLAKTGRGNTPRRIFLCGVGARGRLRDLRRGHWRKRRGRLEAPSARIGRSCGSTQGDVRFPILRGDAPRSYLREDIMVPSRILSTERLPADDQYRGAIMHRHPLPLITIILALW